MLLRDPTIEGRDGRTAYRIRETAAVKRRSRDGALSDCRILQLPGPLDLRDGGTGGSAPCSVTARSRRGARVEQMRRHEEAVLAAHQRDLPSRRESFEVPSHAQPA
jgi:hypothetical protein